ncbi:MAG: DNA polymerase III subunit delta' [Nitrospiraceae bacterium]
MFTKAAQRGCSEREQSWRPVSTSCRVMPFSDIIGHERPKALLQAAIRHDRIAHAYLFHGERAIGKRLTAVRFAQAVNCETESSTKQHDACGVCRSCQQIEAVTHPDFALIAPDPEQAVPQIKIEQIRELEPHVIYRPLIGRRKVCVIDNADRMTIGAANALLKTLEEPPSHCLFLLISSRPYALPATVRSRCQTVRFAVPPQSEVETALIAARGLSPSDARFLAILNEGRLGDALAADLQDARARQQECISLIASQTLQSISALLTTAESWTKADRAAEALTWIARWIRDVLVAELGGDTSSLLHADRRTTLTRAAGMQVDGLLDLLTDIETMEHSATRHLNLHMALENVLLRLRDAMSIRTTPAAQ